MKKEAVAKSKLAQAPFLSNPTALVRKTETETSLQTRAISSCSSSRFPFVPVPYSFYLSCSIFFRCCFCIFLPENEKRATLGELSGAREMAFSSCFSEDLKTTLKNWSQKLEAPEFPEISLLGSQSSFSFFPSFLPSPLFHIFSPDSQDLKLYHQLDNRFQYLSINVRREKERKVSGKQARKEK